MDGWMEGGREMLSRHIDDSAAKMEAVDGRGSCVRRAMQPPTTIAGWCGLSWLWRHVHHTRTLCPRKKRGVSRRIRRDAG